MPDAASLVAKIGADTSSLARGLSQADAMIKGSAQTMSSSAKSAGTGVGESMGAGILSGLAGQLAGMATIGGVAMLARQAINLSEYGAKVTEVGEGFREQFGVRAVAGLELLRKASRGTVDDMSLMQSASRAAFLGIGSDFGDLAKLMQVAKARGEALGIGTQEAFEQIVRGVGQLSPRMLYALGITKATDEAMDAYAVTLGKTSGQLSESEKKSFLLSQVTAMAGVSADGAAEAFDRLAAAQTNASAAVGKALVTSGAPGAYAGAGTMVMRGIASAADETAKSYATLNEQQALLTKLYQQSKLSWGELAASKAAMAGMWAEIAMGSASYQQITNDIDQMNQVLGVSANDLASSGAEVDYLSGRLVEAAVQAGTLSRAMYSIPTWIEMHVALTGDQEVIQKILNIQAVTGGFGTIAQGIALPAGVPSSGPGGDAWLAGRQGLKLQRTVADDIARDAEATQKVVARMAAASKGGGGGGKSALQKAGEEAAQEARSAVESILTPSTARYVGGAYVDAWDEFARRLKSAVSDPKSMWKGLLGGRSGAEAEAFANEEVRAFYAGMRPGEINWSGFDAAYKNLLEEKQAREAMIAMAMARVGGKGNKAEVAAALGLKGGADAAGLDMAAVFATGLAASPGAKELTSAFQKELATQTKIWVGMGELSVSWFRKGLTGTSQATLLDMTKSLFPVLWPMIEARLGGRP